jgi:hypothetical protein
MLCFKFFCFKTENEASCLRNDTFVFLHLLSQYSIHLIILGMSELAKERPPNPVEWLASYLIQHDPQRSGASKGPR